MTSHRVTRNSEVHLVLEGVYTPICLPSLRLCLKVLITVKSFFGAMH